MLSLGRLTRGIELHFALSDILFHWQSHNSVSPVSAKGLNYINHRKNRMRILLFVREKNEDECGNTMTSVFLGEGNLLEHSGSKPMSIIPLQLLDSSIIHFGIKWELKEPMPPYLWKASAKMAIG
jgi:hypothetical protein